MTERPTYEALLKKAAAQNLKHGSSLPVWREEAERARREESQFQDRIHALEAQQAELIRQVKEKDAEIARLQKEVEHRLGEMNLQARWTFESKEDVRVLADALEASRRRGPATDGVREQVDAALRRVGRL